MSKYSRIAAVTGGNKGIGYACVRQLALQYPKSSFNNGPLLIYLTARDKERGEKALQDILGDPQLKQARVLEEDGGLANIKYRTLDIDDHGSIRDFATALMQDHPTGIDFLINNAGIALDGFNAGIVKKTVHCNYYGTMQVTKHLLPHINGAGRIVNVASVAGLLDARYAAPIRQRFLDATTTDEISSLMEDFTSAVSENKYKESWPGAAYRVSKAGLIAVTRIIALENAKTGSKVLINSCCPGYVDTDMSKHNGTRSPDEGARTPVFLALADLRGSNGEFWKDEKVADWHVAR